MSFSTRISTFARSLALHEIAAQGGTRGGTWPGRVCSPQTTVAALSAGALRLCRPPRVFVDTTPDVRGRCPPTGVDEPGGALCRQHLCEQTAPRRVWA